MRGELVIHAVLPFRSLDAVDTVWERAGLPVLTNEDMKCFLCELPECVDCIGKGRMPKRAGRPKNSSYVIEGQIGLSDKPGEGENPL